MNPILQPHPRFRLNGVPFEGDPSAFFRAVKNTFGNDQKSQDYARDITQFLAQCLDDTPTILCHTSGTTGTPKPIALEKTRMLASARMTCRRFSLDAGTRALLCLPIPYIAGRMMIVRALTAGWNLETTVPTSHFLEGTSGTYDFAAVVPLQLYAETPHLSRLRKILVGGGNVSETFLRELSCQNLPDTSIYQSYAMTETITHVAIRELHPLFEPSYTALEGVTFSLSPTGTLQVDAPAVAPGKIITNDIAELLDPLHFIWRGRADTILNSGGIKIFPEEIEATLSALLSGRYFVAGLPDDRLGEKLSLFVEGRPENFPTLQHFLDTRFDPYHRPRQTIFLDEFPLTPTGKTDRRTILSAFIKKG